LLDEPAAGMDPRARRDLRDIVQELHRLGKTILISSHLLEDLAGLCTHLGIMCAGALVAEGSAEEIVQAVVGEAQLRVTLLDRANRERARQLIEESYPAAGDIDDEGESSLIVRLGGAGQDAAALVERLSRRGVQMTEFALLRPTLEDVVLQVTAREADAR
jgi:ABC-2 type transport system ATP-binding protein